jgi:ACS family glucarate transporter-like MFS transporter
MTAQRTSYVRWLLVLWMFVLSATAYLDRVNISVAAAKLTEEFHLTNQQLGFIFSAFLFGYALSQTPAGWLADRFGHRRALTAGVVWWGVFSALTALTSRSFANPFVALLGIRFVLGLGEAVMYPASNQFTAQWVPARERGTANGIIFAGVGIGAGISPPLITFIMLRYGWRSSFLICALIGLVVGAIWFLISRDTPQSHPAVSAAELALIENGIPQAAATKNDGRLSWLDILSSGNVWTLSFAYFCFGYVAQVFFNWFYLYLARVRGLNLKTSSYYAMLPFLAMAICSPLGGIVSDVLSRKLGPRFGRCAICVVGFALTALFVVWGSGAANARIASFVLAGGAGSLYLSQSAFWAVSANIGGKSAGSVSGFMNMANQFAGMISASLTPWIATRFSWNSGFRSAATVAALGALAWLFVDPQATLSPLSDDYSK